MTSDVLEELWTIGYACPLFAMLHTIPGRKARADGCKPWTSLGIAGDRILPGFVFDNR
jgi:hypothetical protein